MARCSHFRQQQAVIQLIAEVFGSLVQAQRSRGQLFGLLSVAHGGPDPGRAVEVLALFGW